MSSGISIILCCYNSAQRIHQTIQHISRLSIPPQMPVEVIVVDNASTDDTAAIAAHAWKDAGQPFDLRVVTESSPGLSSARIRGIREAAYEVLIYCDDDNWLSPDYALVAIDVLERNPGVAIAGGRTEPVFESAIDLPAWFQPLSGGYALGGDPGACVLPKGEIVWGAGMVCKRSVLQELLDSGFHFISSDRRGKALSAGGDLELCQAMQFLGYELYHDGRLTLRHWIPRERLTWDYAIRLSMGFGAATVVSDPQRVFEHPHQKVKNAIRKSFPYQFLRSSMALIPHLASLLRLPRDEGNLDALAAAPRLGRWKAIVDLNWSLRQVVDAKLRWMDRARETSVRRRRAADS